MLYVGYDVQPVGESIMNYQTCLFPINIMNHPVWKKP